MAPSISFCKGLSESAIYNRCYSQLTGHPIPRGSTILAQIKAGKLSGTDACKSLLDKTELDASSGALTESTNQESFWILNNFYAFHRSWFSGNSVEQIQGYNDEVGRGTRDIYDMTEPGLAITRAMFAKNAKYSDIVTLGTGVQALREDNALIRSIVGWSVSFPGRSLYGNNADLDANLFNFRGSTLDFRPDGGNSVLAVLPKIATGELRGVRPTQTAINIPNINLVPFSNATLAANVPGLNFSFDASKTLGGGILGSPSYILLTFGHEFGLTMNGQTKVPRRWAKSNMETFMCSTLPALREGDISQFLAPSSSAPFRKSTSCLQCHSNLDRMAYTLRNVMINNTDFTALSEGSNINAKLAIVMSTFRPEMSSVAGWPTEAVADFHRQIPSGKIYYRSFNGDLVDESVNNVAELGAAFAQKDDFYQCAAKRYFQYLTGIQVALYDRKDPANAELNKALSPEAIADRQFVEDLAASLKKNQSVKEMIKTIISSDYYSSPNFRP